MNEQTEKFSQSKQGNCIILIPVYKQRLTDLEKMSLLQCVTVFEKREICFLAPKHINSEYYKKFAPNVRFEYLDPEFFKGISGYNMLMLSKDFYNRFVQYQYILIYQLDAWVFRDELDMWINLELDYIGAPLEASTYAARGKYVVGNGGFSLRKPASFLRVLTTDGKMYNFRRLIEFFRNHIENMKPHRCIIPLLRMLGFDNRTSLILHKLSDGSCNEDYLFFELSERNHHGGLIFATPEQAMKFSWDRDGDFFSNKENVNLPFGCHGITDRKFFEKIQKIEALSGEKK